MGMKKKRKIDVSRGKLGMDASPKFECFLINIEEISAYDPRFFYCDS